MNPLKPSTLCLTVLLALSVAAAPALAQVTCTTGAEIRIPGAAGTAFGSDVALSGDVLAVAAPNADTVLHSDAGAVHVYRRDVDGNWAFEQTLESPEPENFRRFGQAIAVQDDFLVAGDRLAGVSPFATRGAVHFFRHQLGAWSLQDSFLGEAGNDFLGEAVAIDVSVPLNAPGGSAAVYTAAAGAPNQDWGEANNKNYGAAYVFELRADQPESGWAQTIKVCRTPSDDEWCLPDPALQQSDLWGSAVAVAGEFMPVGATEGTNVDGGKARLMRRANSTGTFYAWASDGIFVSDEPRANEHFGGPLAAARNGVIAVGRSRDALYSTPHLASKAYIYRAPIGASPVLEAALTLGGSERRFGIEVAVKKDSGTVVLVGNDYEAQSRPGQIHVFVPAGGGWIQDRLVLASDGVNNNQLGKALAIDGDWIAAGAPGVDSAYLFVYCDPVFRSGGFE